MSRKAKLSIFGLWTYDNTVLDGLTANLPSFEDADENVHTLDGSVLVDNILLEYGELEILYPDPDFCKMAITAWALKQKDVWQELFDTMFYDYDPIENYYRKEHWTDDFTHGHKKDTDLTHGHKITMDVEDTTVNSVTGYNGSTFADHDKSVFSNKDTETHSGKDSTSETNSGKDSDVRDGYARGNIGVMSTQQMIEMQRETVAFNMYDTIMQEFKERFCIMIY